LQDNQSCNYINDTNSSRIWKWRWSSS
jgi:hypothetical protein